MGIYIMEAKFKHWDKVYLKHDPEQREFFVLAVIIRLRIIEYEIASGSVTLIAEEDELTNEQNHTI